MGIQLLAGSAAEAIWIHLVNLGDVERWIEDLASVKKDIMDSSKATVWHCGGKGGVCTALRP